MSDTLVILMVGVTVLVAIAVLILMAVTAIWRLASDIMTALDKVVYMMSIDSPIPTEGLYDDYGND